ncbi:MAG: type IX secretion system membrane protein PorP/SprF [Bacteroidetes bacterium]|nr:type IX secretion system membrane protein PorP/SprF [Bacteroidota bacterium]
MLKCRGFILTILLFAVSAAKAQDIHFTQFYSTSMYLNPAFAGADRCSKFSLTARNQWTGIHKGYSTYLVSYDGPIPKYNSGLGIMFATDVAGSGGLKTTIFNLNYSYSALLTRKVAIRFGAQAGGQQISLGYGNLLFGDQVVRGGNVSTIEDPAINCTFLDLGAGTLLYSEKYWLGVSTSHLNRPNQSLLGYGNSNLPIKTSVHGGIKIKVNSPEKKNETEYIVPAINYQNQNKFSQVSWGLYYIKSPLNFGLWYRGIPFTNYSQKGYSSNDGIAVLVAVETPKFHFGYSYDITLSRLTMASGGAHEITCYYKICKKRKTKFKMLLPCPKF